MKRIFRHLGSELVVAMTDDGMLVNFAIEDEILKSKPVFKGGQWRDRLSAKRSTRPRTEVPTERQDEEIRLTTASSTNATNGSNYVESPASRPHKRQKLDKSSSPAHPPVGSGAKSLPSQASKGDKGSSSREVISSLFTYNPTSKSSSAEQPQDAVDAEPSNAPLPEGIANFTSLGLTSTLSAHLLTKHLLKAPTAIQASAVKQLLKDESDAFIQAETGSGKTLGYLLPIVQRIMALSQKEHTDIQASRADQDGAPRTKVHRNSGLFAIILAPTRELSSQISGVLGLLLQKAPYIVSSTVIGGEKKKSEKARLRKGVNILVATPGRLADHLANTKVLDISQVRWLVLDEGDRLMELGFEEQIKDIIQKLRSREGPWAKQGLDKIEKGRTATIQTANGEMAATQETLPEMASLPKRRITVLCSATMKMTVQRLGEMSLQDAVHIKVEPKAPVTHITNDDHGPRIEPTNGETPFQAPTQLKQSYIIVPAKQRLVTLAALLKHTFARHGSVMKAIVFLSCADSVDFHFSVFTRPTESSTSNSHTTTTTAPAIPLTSTSNPSLTISRLHGSLPQPIRTSTLRSFAQSSNPAILLCTDVASRGLDLPNIELVIEYDPAFSSDDHLPRAGRTARAGKAGRAECFLLPGGEEGYVSILQEGIAGGMRPARRDADEVLRKGFTPKNPSSNSSSSNVGEKRRWQDAATEWQLEVERWVVDEARAAEMAMRAFKSHVRAYATHVSGERGMFDVKALHLGHLCKAFALRERPAGLGRGGGAAAEKKRSRTAQRGGGGTQGVKKKGRTEEVDGQMRNGSAAVRTKEDAEQGDGKDAARRMRAKMREHMAVASEFNIG